MKSITIRALPSNIQSVAKPPGLDPALDYVAGVGMYDAVGGGNPLTYANEGAQIARWENQGTLGAAGHATQATAANRPTVLAYGANCEPATSYHTNQWFDVPNVISAWTAGTLFFVYRVREEPPTASTWGTPYHFGTHTNFNTELPFVTRNATDAFGTTARKSIGSMDTPFAGPRKQGRYFVYCAISAANDWRCYLNNSAWFSTATNTVGFPTNPRIGRGTSTPYWRGQVTRVSLFASALSNGDRTAFYNYLVERHSLQAG